MWWTLSPPLLGHPNLLCTAHGGVVTVILHIPHRTLIYIHAHMTIDVVILRNRLSYIHRLSRVLLPTANPHSILTSIVSDCRYNIVLYCFDWMRHYIVIANRGRLLDRVLGWFCGHNMDRTFDRPTNVSDYYHNTHCQSLSRRIILQRCVIVNRQSSCQGIRLLS